MPGRHKGSGAGPRRRPNGPTEARTQAPGRSLGSFVFRAGALSLGAQAAVSPGRSGCGPKPPPSVTRAPWTRRLPAQSSCDPAVATLAKTQCGRGPAPILGGGMLAQQGSPHQRSYRPPRYLVSPQRLRKQLRPASARGVRQEPPRPNNPGRPGPIRSVDRHGRAPTTAASRSMCATCTISTPTAQSPPHGSTAR
jgi:hypothetical protein